MFMCPPPKSYRGHVIGYGAKRPGGTTDLSLLIVSTCITGSVFLEAFIGVPNFDL